MSELETLEPTRPIAMIFTRDKDGVERREPVLAQATKTPGIVVTPHVGGGGAFRFRGDWVVTHAASGLALPVDAWGDLDIDTATRVGDALSTLPVDWTADKDTVVAACQEHMEAMRLVIRDAQYPAPKPDGPEDAPPAGEIAPYPKTEAQATADVIARHITRGLQHRAKDTWTLIKRDDADGVAIYSNHASAFVAEWALVTVLRAFAAVDQRAADYAARDIWDGWESGDTTHEEVYEWAREYGLPPLPGDGDIDGGASVADIPEAKPNT